MPTFASGTVYYVAMTLVNTTLTPSAVGMPQQVVLNPSNYQAYLASDLSNVNWQDGNGNILTSWRESGTSSTDTSAIYWVKLPVGIAGKGSIVIYLCFYDTNTNVLNNTTTGVAPQLTPTYAQYDNGASVFTNYWRFGGLTALPSPWVLTYNSAAGTFGASYYEIGSTGNDGGITTSSSFNITNLLFEVAAVMPLTNATAHAVGAFGIGDANATSTYFIGGGGGDIMGGNSNGAALGYNNSGVSGQLANYSGSTEIATSQTYTASLTVFSVMFITTGIGDTMAFLVNYGQEVSTTTLPATTTLPLTILASSGLNGTQIYWARLRIIPPPDATRVPSSTPMPTVIAGLVTPLSPTAIQNVLVTAIPTQSGVPTVSGFTGANGQVTLPLRSSVTYNLVFSGTAIGKVQGFVPANTTFTLYMLRNKGQRSISVSGAKLSAGQGVFALQGSLPVKALKTFASWQPQAVFKAYRNNPTSLIMPRSNISVSYTSTTPAQMYTIDGEENGAYVATNRVYDAVSNSWASAVKDTTVRSAIAAATVNEKIYAVDGYNGAYLKLNHAYDASTNTWSTRTSDLHSRYTPAGGVVASKVYVVDGYNGATTDFNDSYNPQTNTWASRVADLLDRYVAAAAGLFSRLYVIDGYNGTSYLANNNAYDPTTNTWSARAADTTARYFPAAGALGSKIYVVNGYNGAYLATNHAYDPATNTWSAKASALAAKYGPVAGVMVSKLYVVDGTPGTGVAAGFNNAYDPATNTWSRKSSDVTDREFLGAGVPGG